MESVIDSGIVTTAIIAGGNSLSDTSKDWANNVHKNRLVRITQNQGAGQTGVILGNSHDSLVVRQPWSWPIGVGATYVIVNADFMQMFRDVFGGGSDINVHNPLETHDPTIDDIEDKLDHPSHGLAALKALIDSLAGGAFYGSYGPRNVEVDNDVDFGVVLYDPSGNIITVGEITPGTYTIRRVRVAVDTEIVAAAASSEAAGRVFVTYNFPAASWNVGDIFYIIFSGIIVTIDGVATEYPNLFIWGRVVREADVSAKVDAVEVKLDLPAANETANTKIAEVVGQKGDAANETASQASIIGLLRAIITTYLSDGSIGLAQLQSEIADIETKLDTPANFMADVSGIITSQGRQLFSMDFWSTTQEELEVDAAGGTETLPSVEVAGLPAGITIVRAVAMFKFRMVENTYAGANALNGAQHIQVQSDAPGTWRDAISIVDTLCTFTEAAREGGDVWVGDHNIEPEITAYLNDIYSFQWVADALQEFIRFNDIQCGIRVFYSV